jgi:negative regulator of sigma-B (phosphoserine phosphatase)
MRYGVVFRPKTGQRVSGDAYLIIDEGKTCLATVVDGLGSGSEAAHASRLALATVGEQPWAELTDILRQCHLALLGTRGAVMSLLRIEFGAGARGGQVSYAGVGNVDFHGQSASNFSAWNAYGIIGSRFPKVQVFQGLYTPGDLFVLSTDGISRQFRLGSFPAARGQPPQVVADKIAEGFGRMEDDVTVLVMA